MITRARRSAPHHDELLMTPPPYAPPKMRVSARPWPQMDTGSSRPGYGLRPDRVWAAFRAAEQGDPSHQCDIFEDVIENDGHTRGQILARNNNVSRQPWVIAPGGDDALDVEAAEVLATFLRNATAGVQGGGVLDLIAHIHDALGFGYSIANTQWMVDDALDIGPAHFALPAHRRLWVDNDSDELRWRTPDNMSPGEQMKPGEWIVARQHGRKVVRAGIFRTVVWWVLFKRMSITDWIVFAEKFGLPVVIGTYKPQASEASRQALLQALVDVGADGQAIIADTTKLVFESAQVRTGDLSALHPSIAARCDQEISKIVTGGTLNVENGGSGSYGLGQVHEKREQKLGEGDAFWISDRLQRGLIAPFMSYNPRFRRAKAPTLVIQANRESREQALTYQIMQAMGFPISRTAMSLRFQLPIAKGTDMLVAVPNAKPPASSESPARD